MTDSSKHTSKGWASRLREAWPPRITWALPSLVLVVMVGIVAMNHTFEVRAGMARVTEMSEQRVRADGAIIAARLADDFRNGRLQRARDDLRGLTADSSLSFALIAADESVFFAWPPRVRELIERSDSTASDWYPLLQQVSSEGQVVVTISDGSSTVGLFRVPMGAIAADGAGAESGILLFAHDVSTARGHAIEEANRDTLVLLLVVLLFTGLLAAYFHLFVTERLVKLQSATARIGSSATAVDPGLTGSDEFSVLSRAIAVASRQISGGKREIERRGQMYKALFQGVPVPIFLVDPETMTFRTVNDAAVERFGYSRVEFDGLSVRDLCSDADERCILEGLEAIRAEGVEGHLGVVRHLAKAGQVIWSDVTVHGVEVDGRRVLLVVALDVTEQRAAQAELFRRDQILSGVSDAAATLLSADEVTDGITSALATLGNSAAASRAYVFEIHTEGDGHVASNRWAWLADGIQWPPREELQGIPLANFAGWHESLQAGDAVVRSFEDLPEREKAFFAPFDIRSLAVVPVSVRGAVWGFIGFDECTDDRVWSDTEVDALRAAAGLIGAAVERDKMIKDLRHSERRLSTAERTAGVGSWEWDVVRDEVVWSDALYHIWGLDPSEQAGSYEQYLGRIHPDDRDRVHQTVAGAMANGTSFSVDHRIVLPNGETRSIHGQGVVERENGLPIRMAGTAQDVTDMLRSERELRRVHEQLRAVADNIPGAVYRRVISPQGEISYPYSTGSFYARFNVTGEDVAKDPSLIFRHVLDADRERFMEVARDRTEGHLEHVFRVIDAKGKTRWVRSLSKGQSRPDGSFVRDGIILDITDQKALEEQLRQAQKLEAVGQLTGGIAHDFNNLLSIVLGNLDLLEMPGADGKAALDERALGEIRSAVQSGADLVKSLMGFSRRADLSMTELDLAEGVEGMSQLLRRLLPETIDYGIEIAGDCGTVMADSGALQQILINLVTNARDAMPNGGDLRVRVSRATDAAPPDGTPRSPLGYGVIEVSDTGVGMSPETVMRVFEPFFTTKPVGKGTGLGLGMVHGLVEQHGGFTHVQSSPGEGSTFSVHLPVTALSPQATPIAESPEEDSQQRALRVLLVEDQEALRRTTQLVLEHLGYEVITAADGREGADIARDLGIEIDLILTDFVMPEMTALQMYDLVREVRPNIPFVFTSGYLDGALRERGGLPTDVAFLPKPWTQKDIGAKIDEAFAAVSANGVEASSPQTTPSARSAANAAAV